MEMNQTPSRYEINTKLFNELREDGRVEFVISEIATDRIAIVEFTDIAARGAFPDYKLTVVFADAPTEPLFDCCGFFWTVAAVTEQVHRLYADAATRKANIERMGE